MQRATWTDERFEQVDKRLDQMDKRLDQVDRRFEQVDRRFELVEVEISGLRSCSASPSLSAAELRREMGCMHSDLKGDIAELRTTFNRAAVGVILCLIGVLASVAFAG